ncbi:hypothetical protein TNCV_371391 [Trichonephila clavipes]|nr:hypothetical protein TNCV_371391 [Trichonephila clavipes]
MFSVTPLDTSLIRDITFLNCNCVISLFTLNTSLFNSFEVKSPIPHYASVSFSRRYYRDSSYLPYTSHICSWSKTSGHGMYSVVMWSSGHCHKLMSDIISVEPWLPVLVSLQTHCLEGRYLLHVGRLKVFSLTWCASWKGGVSAKKLSSPLDRASELRELPPVAPLPCCLNARSSYLKVPGDPKVRQHLQI